ncbi:type II secretion system F family protein [Olleya sp. Bg11-27]|uniref:type II secretion system F family protein n=1 Tax=Olleya sp. Bg11-27 TaxID=2058135 RepID=UPI000C304DAE|nr:type II secretion system F family protein [Olleya sp. Bg11-27]AUC77557.1 type II secretion system F family protein [Olleya sp. Bg11-27]
MGFNLENITKQQEIKKEASNKTSFLKKEITFFGHSFSNKIKEDFYTEIAVLLKAGITLKDALELLQKALKKEKHQAKLKLISEDIVSGLSLSEAIKKQKEFTDYEYYSIKIGEETGTLTKVSEQLGAFFLRKNEQRRNLVGALTYPAIILSTAVLVVIFMLQFVVPMFQDIFLQQKVELPAVTKVIIYLSEMVKSYGWLVLVLVIVLLFLRPFLNKKIGFKKAKDKLVLKLPFIGDFVKMVYLSQFTQAVSLLTASKVPVVNSIQLVKEMIDFYPLKNALEEVEQNILRGQSLSESLSLHDFFDDKMVALVKVAEETNQNEFIFERLNTQYNTQVQQRSKLLSTVMEPFIILIVGVLVGVILIAMYLPMFKLSSVLG